MRGNDPVIDVGTASPVTTALSLIKTILEWVDTVDVGLTMHSDVFVATVEGELLFIDMEAQTRPFWHMKVEVSV